MNSPANSAMRERTPSAAWVYIVYWICWLTLAAALTYWLLRMSAVVAPG